MYMQSHNTVFKMCTRNTRLDRNGKEICIKHQLSRSTAQYRTHEGLCAKRARKQSAVDGGRTRRQMKWNENALWEPRRRAAQEEIANDIRLKSRIMGLQWKAREYGEFKRSKLARDGLLIFMIIRRRDWFPRRRKCGSGLMWWSGLGLVCWAVRRWEEDTGRCSSWGARGGKRKLSWTGWSSRRGVCSSLQLDDDEVDMMSLKRFLGLVSERWKSKNHPKRVQKCFAHFHSSSSLKKNHQTDQKEFLLWVNVQDSSDPTSNKVCGQGISLRLSLEEKRNFSSTLARWRTTMTGRFISLS